MSKQLYVQRGGVPTLIALIGQFVMKIAGDVVIAIKSSLAGAFLIYPEGGTFEFNEYFVGIFWKFIFWCFKSSFYLLIFCFGGPVLILFGIIYMYQHIFKKMNERSDYEEEKAKAEGEGGDEAGGDEAGGDNA